MKKLSLLFLLIPVLLMAQLPVGTERKTVITDTNGNVISTPLVFSNQVKMAPAPTLTNHIVRYMDLINATNGIVSITNSLATMTFVSNHVTLATNDVVTTIIPPLLSGLTNYVDSSTNDIVSVVIPPYLSGLTNYVDGATNDIVVTILPPMISGTTNYANSIAVAATNYADSVTNGFVSSVTDYDLLTATNFVAYNSITNEGITYLQSDLIVTNAFAYFYNDVVMKGTLDLRADLVATKDLLLGTPSNLVEVYSYFRATNTVAFTDGATPNYVWTCTNADGSAGWLAPAGDLTPATNYTQAFTLNLTNSSLWTTNGALVVTNKNGGYISINPDYASLGGKYNVIEMTASNKFGYVQLYPMASGASGSAHLVLGSSPSVNQQALYSTGDQQLLVGGGSSNTYFNSATVTANSTLAVTNGIIIVGGPSTVNGTIVFTNQASGITPLYSSNLATKAYADSLLGSISAMYLSTNANVFTNMAYNMYSTLVTNNLTQTSSNLGVNAYPFSWICSPSNMISQVRNGIAELDVVMSRSVGGTLSVKPEIYILYGDNTMPELFDAGESIALTSTLTHYSLGISCTNVTIPTTSKGIVLRLKATVATGNPQLNVAMGQDYISVLRMPVAGSGVGNVFTYANNTYDIGTTQKFAQFGSPEYTNTYAGTSVVIDAKQGNSQTIVLTNNPTITISNLFRGENLTLTVAQDGTGGRVSTFASQAGTTLTWLGGFTPTNSSAASAIDVFGFIRRGNNYVGIGPTPVQTVYVTNYGPLAWTNFSISVNTLTNSGTATNTIFLMTMPPSNVVYNVAIRGLALSTNTRDDVVAMVGVSNSTSKFSGAAYSLTNSRTWFCNSPDCVSETDSTNLILTVYRNGTNGVMRNLTDVTNSTVKISVLQGVLP